MTGCPPCPLSVGKVLLAPLPGTFSDLPEPRPLLLPVLPPSSAPWAYIPPHPGMHGLSPASASYLFSCHLCLQAPVPQAVLGAPHVPPSMAWTPASLSAWVFFLVLSAAQTPIRPSRPNPKCHPSYKILPDSSHRSGLCWLQDEETDSR